MISLRELQRDMVSFALGKSGAGGREWILDNGLSAERRMGVYRNNAQIGFANALQATYPVLVRLSGKDWFNQTALSYQRISPSRSGDLNAVGSEFANFLDETLSDGEYAYFADVARLEWAYSETLNKPEARPGDFEGIGSLADEDYRYLRFSINPTASLIDSQYPLYAIWSSNRSESASSAIIHLNQGASRILVTRRAAHVDVRELSLSAFALLQAFAAGATVVAGVEFVLETVGEFDLTQALGELIGLNALLGLGSTAAGDDDVI